MFQVTFTFENQPDVVVSVPPDSNLLEVAREANVPSTPPAPATAPAASAA